MHRGLVFVGISKQLWIFVSHPYIQILCTEKERKSQAECERRAIRMKELGIFKLKINLSSILGDNDQLLRFNFFLRKGFRNNFSTINAIQIIQIT